MNKQLNDYLEKVEKGLKSLSVSERADIVREISSEIMELEGEGLTAEAITARLGDPKALARSYLGDSITKTTGFSIQKLVSVLAFYGYAGFSGVFVLPVTSISAVTFLLCSLLCPMAGLVKLAGFLLGHDIPQIQFVMGSYSAGPVAMVPITLVLGALCLLIGWGFWRLTILVVRSLSRKK